MAGKATRVPVLFGEAGSGKSKRKKTAVLVLDRIAKELGLTTAKSSELTSDKKTSSGGKIYLKGDKDNSIRIYCGETTSKGNKKFLSVPYPAGATISQIATFVKKAKKAKSFTMPTGQTYYVGDSSQ